MKKTILTFVVAVAALTVLADEGRTDVTAVFLNNPSFEADNISTLSPVNNSADGLRGYSVDEPKGWTVTKGSNVVSLIVTAECFTDNNFGKVTTLADGTQAYYLRMGWSTGVATIRQTISALPKGKYQLQASIRSAYANQATSSYGLVAPGSSTSTTFTQGSQGCMTSMKWEVKTVNFEQMADGTATVGFDITWQSGGSCILFDDVRLYQLSDDYIEPEDPSEASPTEGRVVADFVSEADMKDDLLQMLANFATYMKNDFQDCQWPNSIDEVCGCFRGENTMGNDERGVRPNADLSMICAFLVKYAKGKVVLPTGVTWDDLELMAMKSLVFAYSTHKANKLKVCSGGNYWGSVSNADHVWESSLWAMSVAYSAFFQWEKLSDAQRNYIYQLLKSECNYELERSIPTGYAGDTKAEENGWEADILAATLGMFPDDPLAPRWFQRLREFAVNSYSQKDDAQDNTIIDPEYDQKTVSDLYKGKNLYDDFTLQNHNYFHTSYQNVVVQELGEAALALKLFQKGLSGTEQWRTNALMHNNQKVMDEVLYWLALADGELAMPNGNDWSLFLYDQITSYSTNACFLRDPHALMLENLAYKMIKARQTTTADGSWLLRPDVGARRMGVEAHRVMMTWLMHETLPTADLTATTWEDFNRQYAQAKVFSSQNIVRAATDSRFTCFSWSTGLNSYTGYIAANSVDKNKIVVPFRANNTGNFLGWYEVQSKSTNATPVEQQDENGQRSMYNVQCIGNSFVMNGELQTNDAALNNRFALYSTPGNVVIYLDYVRANQNATITAEKGGLMAISVDELTKTSRKFFTEESDAEGGRITSKQLDGSVFTKLPASWVNIDNELGIITSTQQMAFGDKANNNSINTAKLYTLYSDQSRQVKTGDIVGSRYAFYYSKVTAQQTMELNEQGGGLKAEEGWNAALAFDPDQTGYLLLCNFCGDEACTLNNILTHKGAPVFTARTRIGSAGSTARFEATLNHSVANTLKFFIAGTGLDAIQEKGDSTAIYLLNNVKGKNAITINASDQSQSMSKDVTLFNMVLKAYILDGELIVEEADYFPGEEQPDGIMAMDDGQWTLDDEGGDIYDLSGRRITNSEFTIQNSKLPRGIYIVGGKKKKIQGLP